jgi:hypothetical protein
MAFIEFNNAFFIKLGRGGAFEADSIDTGKMRFGWQPQSLDDINAHSWDVIEQQLRREFEGKPAGVATTDFRALRNIVESTPDDVWITFHQAKLWWARLASTPVEEDSVSRFRRTIGPWSDKAANGRLLVGTTFPERSRNFRAFEEPCAESNMRNSCSERYAEFAALSPRTSAPAALLWLSISQRGSRNSIGRTLKLSLTLSFAAPDGSESASWVNRPRHTILSFVNQSPRLARWFRSNRRPASRICRARSLSFRLMISGVFSSWSIHLPWTSRTPLIFQITSISFRPSVLRN